MYDKSKTNWRQMVKSSYHPDNLWYLRPLYHSQSGQRKHIYILRLLSRSTLTEITTTLEWLIHIEPGPSPRHVSIRYNRRVGEIYRQFLRKPTVSSKIAVNGIYRLSNVLTLCLYWPTFKDAVVTIEWEIYGLRREVALTNTPLRQNMYHCIAVVMDD